MNKLDQNQPGLQCFWSNLKDHPKCIHGPTLLFGQYNDNKWNKFYICAACRQRKLCPFYLEYGQTLTKAQEAKWTEKTKQYLSTYHRQKLFIEFHKILAASTSRRLYCHTCDKLLLLEDKNKHENHDIIEELTDHQMNHPTEILKPAVNCKKEAQYLFSKKSTLDIINFLTMFGAEQILCIGAPRIHEYIINNMEGKMSSLLLDLDGRYHNFYGSLHFCWYNLFNNHFFYKDSESVFKDFMTQNEGKNLYIICDPPFGGRVEAMDQTLNTISNNYKKWNNINEDPKVIFIFPYFMEAIMKHKSSPSDVVNGMKDYKMIEYRVEYDNHPLFIKTENKSKLGSPVRIFTNIPVNKFKLAEPDYKFCKKCDRWVTIANKHCNKCKDCTSKDGRSYKHCDACSRCVKDFWIHCTDCNRCNIVEHKCGKVPVIHGLCNKCGKPGHTEKNCEIDIDSTPSLKRPISSETDEESVEIKKRKKDEINEKSKKKSSINDKINKRRKKNKIKSNDINETSLKVGGNSDTNIENSKYTEKKEKTKKNMKKKTQSIKSDTNINLETVNDADMKIKKDKKNVKDNLKKTGLVKKNLKQRGKKKKNETKNMAKKNKKSVKKSLKQDNVP